MIKIKLYDICPEAKAQKAENREITGVTDNTRELAPGNIFVCIKGARFDGHSAAAQMLENGAAAVVVSHDLGLKDQIVTNNTRAMLSRLASAFYGDPSKKLHMLAVTGTNGKTTTANFVKHIINTLGHKCGCIGTVGCDTCGSLYNSMHGTVTTPAPMTLYKWILEMTENGADYCMTEASSQALAQYRFAAERFIAAGFTNLTHDHLDYHGTMEDYFEAKARLFEMCERPVISIDDEYGRRLCERYPDAITFSIGQTATLRADFIKERSDCTEFMFVTEKQKKALKIRLAVPGRYNVQNALCAIGICMAAGFDECLAAKALESCNGVCGRMNIVYNGDFTVITDYAHTDDALEKVLSAVKGFSKGRIICVFGSAGERDKEKRPLMGEVVSRFADRIVLTSDNPAHEDPDVIISEVMKGIDRKKLISAEPDRRRAIELALEEAEKGDIVMLCGKGHETYQVIGDEYIDFCEKDIVNEIMNVKGN